MSFQPSGARLFAVKIDDYTNGEMKGRIDHIRLPGEKRFLSSFHLLSLIQELLDTGNCPGATPIRSLPALYEAKGKTATFQLEILFTQSQSWQGKLSWIEEKREATFRSVLELLMILDEALAL
ncbi:MAG: hypothetical protein VB111_09960 [Clostridiaceae bacterium]|nr:hypothetical protein [Clostridiaceae bacterium]